MSLQELDYWINQVGEEYSKDEDQNDAPSAVDGCAHHAKEQYGQQDAGGAAVGECHFQLSMRSRPGRSLPAGCARVTSAKSTRSVFAIALNFGLLHIIGVGAIVAAVCFRTCHHTFALRVGAFALTLSIHGSILLSGPKTRLKLNATQGPLTHNSEAIVF